MSMGKGDDYEKERDARSSLVGDTELELVLLEP
jgi:hypothetical protein